MTDTRIDVRSPADASIVGSVASLSATEVAAAVTGIRTEQPGWETLGIRGRREWLERYRDWLLDHDDEVTGLLQAETSKPLQEARLELAMSLDLINYYCKNAEAFLADEHPRGHSVITKSKRLTITRHPYPVVGVITPWNVPLLIALADSAPALLAGAAVVVKPSELTPLATQRVIDGWQEIGAPGVFVCTPGAGATGAAVVEEADFIQFTGSTRTGIRIGRRAAERLIPSSLELGGKDAMIVLADADLERASNAAVWGGMFNSGQACVSVERVYVEASVHDEFVRRVTQKAWTVRVGTNDGASKADIGPLISSTQLAIVTTQVQDAVSKGATVVTGGERAQPQGGAFFQPTVLTGVDHTMQVMQEETFGPTLPIMKVANATEAIRLANDSPYGLSASVWTRNTERGREVARRLEAGAVNVNDVLSNLFLFPAPHAGWKKSGTGERLGGAAGIRKYCREQAIIESRITPHDEPLWFPYTPGKHRLIWRLLRFMIARDANRKLRKFGR
ncbi:aldehyde dehydrogenase family protein [[Mycobacterium] nativiensis]|uniref:Aldehyde dehydrogenase n=1 Tax=[Mycobacterium] nativiensis TaxID=2855503 RepID=A0ABU5XPV1_9MYCO|nr:aldehyde dehydrogenase family protein [Mycolicibacter sp. MYC340]MEB3030004.1 aldehyde dehydrogenase family protein [Mycolicibacter sp. MYC340]